MNHSALCWLWNVPGKKKLYILCLTVVQALHGASGALYALLLREIVDAAGGHDSTGFWRGIVWIVLLAAFQLALRAAIRWLSELSRASFENAFKARLMDTLLRRDYLCVSAVHSGEWLNRLTNDTVVVANSCAEIVPGLTGMAVKLVSALVMILILEPRFSSIFIPGGMLLMLFTWLFRKTLKRLHKNMLEADGRLRVFLQEHIGSLLMIHSFAAEAQTAADTADKMREHMAARMRKNSFSNLCNAGFGVAMSGMYLFGVGWCGYGILMGTISFGTLTAITQLITQIQSPFANITGFLPRFYAMLASAERLMEAEEYPQNLREAKPLEQLTSFYENELISFGLSDVSFAYPQTVNSAESSDNKQQEVLEHLSLEIKKGEYVVFTGQSGCGKSTALKLLMCVYQPESGERYYTDSSGVRSDLSSAYRRLFAYVPQGNALMSGSIREVVSFAAPDAAYNTERLSQALRIACAEDFVSELDQGVDTLLGERGAGLSEGQMQRLSIARAVFSGSPILLLDEATSALDAGTEERLLRNLRELTEKTVIIISHRPAALMICDRVLTFTEDGVLHD